MMGKTCLKVTYTSSFEQSRNLAHFKSICIKADKRHACVRSAPFHLQWTGQTVQKCFKSMGTVDKWAANMYTSQYF